MPTKLLPEWISTFHPDRLRCQIERGFLHGAFNLDQRMALGEGLGQVLAFGSETNQRPRAPIGARVSLSIPACLFRHMPLICLPRTV
jgi:hypothetical protein